MGSTFSAPLKKKGHTVLLDLSHAPLPYVGASLVVRRSAALQEAKSSAFGANIVGPVVGGLAQNISFILGMKAFLLIAVLFYALAALAGLLSARQTALAETDPLSA